MTDLIIDPVKAMTILSTHKTQNINQLFLFQCLGFSLQKIKEAFAEMTTANNSIFWTPKSMVRALCQDVGAPVSFFLGILHLTPLELGSPVSNEQISFKRVVSLWFW